MIRCHEMWHGTTKTRFLALILLRTLLLLCYMTVSRTTLTWSFCGGWVLQKVDINLLVLLEVFWVWSPLGLFQILTILVQYLNIDVLKTYFSKFLTTSVEQLFQPAFRWLLLTISWGESNISKNFDPLRKPVYTPVYSLYEIPSKENYLKKCKESCLGGRVLKQISRLELC